MIFHLSSVKKFLADFIGIASSAICFVHCIAAPVLLSAGAVTEEWPWLSYVFIAIAFFSLAAALKENTPDRISALLWASFFVFLFSLMFEEKWPLLEYTGLLASAGIITGHILNIKSCRSCVPEQPKQTTLPPPQTPFIKINRDDERIY
jgi:drug/metabolite transporter (DMT)-like permease